MTTEVKNTRNASVEVLRCLLMFIIVFQHCFSHGIFVDDSPYVDLGLWCLPIAFIWWHVDAFVAISGWYGIKFRWSKFLRLYGVIFFYSIFSLIYQVCVLHEPLNFKAQLIYGGWFGATYTMLMLMAPLLNAGVEALIAKGKRVAFFAWLLFAIGVTLNWCPYTRWLTSVCPLGAGPFSIFHMVFVYVTARMARMLDVQVSAKRLLTFAVVVLVGGVLLMGGSNMLSSWLRHKPLLGVQLGGYSSYDAPHIWIFAICLVMYFDKFVHVSSSSWLGKTALYIGASTFPIFLIHHATSFGKVFYRIPEQWMFEHGLTVRLLVMLFAAIITYVTCLALDSIRRWVWHWMRSRVDAALVKVDEKWDRIVGGTAVESVSHQS